MDSLANTAAASGTSHSRSMRLRSAGYWLATVLVAAELGLGGIWDLARIPYLRDLMAHLGYPSYFLVLLGTGYNLGETGLLAVLTALTALSWALRPASRRTPRPWSTAPLAIAAAHAPGGAPAAPVTGHAPTGAGAATGRLRARRRHRRSGEPQWHARSA